MHTNHAPHAWQGNVQVEECATDMCLPDNVWEQVLAALVACAPRGNPGDAFRLSIVRDLRLSWASSRMQAYLSRPGEPLRVCRQAARCSKP